MRAVLTALALLGATPAMAQHAGHDMPMPESAADPHAEHREHAMQMEEPAATDHAAHDHHAMPMESDAAIPTGAIPREAMSGPEHAADVLFDPAVMAASRSAMTREMGAMKTDMVMIDRLEWVAAKGEDALLWDANARWGDDIDKLWIKTEGEIGSSGEVEEAEVQALWSHAIGPWFDLQAGVRQDIRPKPQRTYLALGVQGLAPYFFEVDAAAFLSQKGEVTGRIEAEYDQRVTQRLITQPRIELNVSLQDVPELGFGSGITSMQAGMRLRYEVVREFAPYVGVEWRKEFGDTARMTRAGGGDPDRVVLIAGLRAWF
ncbi:MAG: copper resistance protein B [Novosphingobium sp.]|nr:copper resistance protein B [Novosphingobium sp.]